jgi:hypothetical protein
LPDHGFDLDFAFADVVTVEDISFRTRCKAKQINLLSLIEVFSDVMKFPRHDMPARKQADGSTRAYTVVGRAELAFSSRQNAIDLILHRSEGQPTRGLRQFRCVFVIDVECLAADDVHYRASMQIIEFVCVRHDEVSAPERVLDCFSFGE